MVQMMVAWLAEAALPRCRHCAFVPQGRRGRRGV